MTWALQVSTEGRASHPPVNLLEEGVVSLVVVLNSNFMVVHDFKPEIHTELAQITTGPSGARLRAIDRVLRVLPGHQDVRTDHYELLPRASDLSEVFLLRPGDVISFANAKETVSCIWTESKVQVNSSATEESKVVDVFDGIAETTPEEETEHEDLDNTVTAVAATQSKSQSISGSKSQRPRATPQLSNQRSVVVQETPTVARVNGVIDHIAAEPYSTARTGQSQNAIHTENPAIEGLELEITHDSDTNHAVPAGLSDSVMGEAPDDETLKKHPKVLISRKRPSPGLDEHELRGPSINGKRAKKNVARSEDDTQDSRMSNIIVNTSPVAPSVKGRRLKSAVPEIEEVNDSTPSRSQRSSQRSTATTNLYEGPTPRVATSSSALTDKSLAVKFLKKQGGAFVESTKEEFNVLWRVIRDGNLPKTPKVLLAITTGTPIVTDKWLTDSAKAGHFLAAKAYRPSTPKQEKDWKFKLESVIGHPQTPFAEFTIHFTTGLHAAYKVFTEIEQVCKAAGAAKVTKKKKKINPDDNVIVLAVEEGDEEAEMLIREGVACYNRDLLPLSIFRGALDLDSDEFKLTAAVAAAGSSVNDTKAKRGRKS
ncbi:hypothetical protein EK21DRAFT_68116 [Setomelanomma holmii]|uniref:BRCT domain-containing protein n=1 Tax=Setomelanomma holmii TaxID=210430 RepID=A0A9P4H9S0_9PLEO|nr:hypothetical protein EK21DRAFT_68116 [Setomelanomma holmii]